MSVKAKQVETVENEGAPNLVSLWEYALAFCLGHGITQANIDWWHDLPSPLEIADTDFFSELAWVVYNAGMRETLIEAKWPALRQAFFGFDPVEVFARRDMAVSAALSIINHRGKANAVADSAVKILTDGPMYLKLSGMAETDALEYMESFPYVGRITRYHLARNCGYDVVKPDRHLVRLATALGYPGLYGPDALVQEISLMVGERKGFIDYILWQWLSIEGSHEETIINLPRILRNWRRE